MYKDTTVNGNFIITPENGQSFQVIKITITSPQSVYYKKTDGTSGRISGNFRVETTTPTDKLDK